MKSGIRILKFYVNIKKISRLLFPSVFLVLELLVAIVLNWQLFGEKYEFAGDGGKDEISIHNPLIIVGAIHSDRLTHPYGTLSGDTPFIKFFSHRTVIKAVCFLGSLILAYWGLLISILWIKALLNRKYLNIRWWVWPVGCIGAHFFFYLLANTAVSNIF